MSKSKGTILLPTTTEKEQLEQHSFQDRSTRFAVDQLLRENGFSILRRTGGVLWTKDRTTYSQEAAERLVPKEALRLAKMRQAGYYRETS